MARKDSKKSNGDGEVSEENRGIKGHNIAGLKELIQSKSPGYLAIKAQRKTLTEEMGEIRESVKEAGIDWKAFENGVKLSIGEPEARNHYLDSLRIVYEALGVGDQATMFPEPDGEVGDEQIRQAKGEGRDLSFEGKPATANPYTHKDPRRASWQEGWMEQQAERAREMGPDKGAPNFIKDQEPAPAA